MTRQGLKEEEFRSASRRGQRMTPAGLKENQAIQPALTATH